ncbi:MAG: hypothetical protein RIS52_1133 [Pseudomonadota bacterium]
MPQIVFRDPLRALKACWIANSYRGSQIKSNRVCARLERPQRLMPDSLKDH